MIALLTVLFNNFPLSFIKINFKDFIRIQVIILPNFIINLIVMLSNSFNLDYFKN